MIFGSYVWGSLADSRGRKSVLVISMLVDFVAAFFSSLAPNFASFLACRFFNGFGYLASKMCASLCERSNADFFASVDQHHWSHQRRLPLHERIPRLQAPRPQPLPPWALLGPWRLRRAWYVTKKSALEIVVNFFLHISHIIWKKHYIIHIFNFLVLKNIFSASLSKNQKCKLPFSVYTIFVPGLKSVLGLVRNKKTIFIYLQIRHWSMFY